MANPAAAPLQVTLIGDQICATGITAQPVALGSLAQRQTIAASNVARAHDLPNAVTPVLLGIEHLSALLQQWPTTRPVLLIEKCATWCEYFLHTHALTKIPAHIHLCRGGWGLCSPLQFSTFRLQLFQQEIADLALQALHLTHIDLCNIAIFGLPEHPWETEYLHYLHQALYSVACAAQFHREHTPVYRAHRATPAAERIGFLQSANLPQQSRLFAPYFPPNVLTDWMMPLTPQDHPPGLFEGATAEALDRDPQRAIERCGRFAASAHALIDRARSERWRAFATINLAPFFGLETLLFHREALRQLDLHHLAFFRDFFSHQQRLFVGGWCFDLIDTHFANGHTTFLQHASFNAALFAPRQCPVYFFPYDYFECHQPITPPLTTRAAMHRDIAIVHTCREYAVRCTEFNELHELITTVSPLGYAAIGPLLWLLRRQLLADSRGCGNTAYWSQLMGTLEWIFHAQNRIRWVIALQPVLSRYRATVYGNGWDGFLPPALIGGSITNTQAREIFRTSTVTIDCTPVETTRLPHATAVECIAVGGCPLVVAPVFGDQHETSVPGFHAQTFAHFRTPAECENLLAKFLGDDTARQQYIVNAQQTWLPTLQSGSFHRPLSELLMEPITPAAADRTFPITQNVALDRWLLRVATGYVYSLAGFVDSALACWEQCLHDPPVPCTILAQRAARCAKEIETRD